MCKITKRIVPVLSIFIVFSVVVSACGGGSNTAPDQVSIRQPRPTFTPTLPPGGSGATSETATPAILLEDASEAGDSAPADTSGEDAVDSSHPSATSPDSTDAVDTADTGTDSGADSEAPIVLGDASADAAPASAGTVSGQIVINTPLVNGRSGPSTEYSVVGIVGRGEEYDIIGRNTAGDWWNVCCYEEQEFWVINDLVDTVGAVDVNSVAVTEPGSSRAAAPSVAVLSTATEASSESDAAEPTSTPEANESDPTPTLASAASAGEEGFDLMLQEQFDESTVVRVYAYIYDQNAQALAGYSVRVTKDGAELPVSESSFGPQAGFTWPVAEPRQRFQNLEVEFPDEDPAGTWTVELIDGSGTIIGPAATFELTANDAQQELYVRYEQL